jgi:3-isopropylmalate/(R)-2-methylmalate dehydratase small subunit
MGRVWKFGDDIDTDIIIPGKYLVINDPEELAKHAFENIRKDFAKHVKRGDVIVAGRNFGSGSSREHAPLALKGAGIEWVIARSFARIFFRNAINIGLGVIETDHVDAIDDGDEVDVDFVNGKIINRTKDEEYEIKRLPEFLTRIIDKGGLINFAKELVRQ